MCLQVEVCWACPQSNLVQMANGQSLRFPAILVVILYLSVSTSQSSSFPPLSCSLCITATTPTLKNTLVSLKKNKQIPWEMEIKLWPWSNFYFPFVFPPLCQIWWLIWTFPLLMKVSWQHALEMKRWALWCPPFLFSFFASILFCLVGVYLRISPLSILSGFVVPGRASNTIWTCSFFFCGYLSLLKAHSSQHIILSHRCPSLLESAECGSASSDSAARFTSGSCVNTHNYCHTQTYNSPTHTHTHRHQSGLQCPAFEAHFHSSHLLPTGHIVSPTGLCWASELEWNWVNAPTCEIWLRESIFIHHLATISRDLHHQRATSSPGVMLL